MSDFGEAQCRKGWLKIGIPLLLMLSLIKNDWLDPNQSV